MTQSYNLREVPALNHPFAHCASVRSDAAVRLIISSQSRSALGGMRNSLHWVLHRSWTIVAHILSWKSSEESIVVHPRSIDAACMHYKDSFLTTYLPGTVLLFCVLHTYRIRLSVKLLACDSSLWQLVTACAAFVRSNPKSVSASQASIEAWTELRTTPGKHVLGSYPCEYVWALQPVTCARLFLVYFLAIPVL